MRVDDARSALERAGYLVTDLTGQQRDSFEALFDVPEFGTGLTERRLIRLAQRHGRGR